MDSGMWWTFGSLAFALAFVAAVAWPAVTIWKARSAARTETEYKELSDRSVRSQEHNERQLHDLADEVAAVNARLHAVERVLQEVD
jgi:hypothetical protein